jgi:hypothetical protein
MQATVPQTSSGNSPLGRKIGFLLLPPLVVLVVVTLRQQRLEGFSAEKVKELFGISEKTLERWMEFYREEFASSPQWKRLRGRLSVAVNNSDLPASLVEQFVRAQQDHRKGLIACLYFLAVGCACPAERLC